MDRYCLSPVSTPPHEDLLFCDPTISALRHTPGGAFGSCRHKLKPYDTDSREYERLIEVFKAHDIGYFF